MEGAAPAELTFRPQLTGHEEGQLFADGQAQAGAAELAGIGTVGLFKAVENGLQLLGGDADAGIGDAEVEGNLAPRLLFARGSDPEDD